MKSNRIFSLFLGAVVLSIAFISCKKDPDETPAPATPAATTGSVTLSFENVFDTAALSLGSTYITANNDTLMLTTFKYYISNIRFIRPDNSSYSEPESYHLVNAASPSSCTFTVGNVPAGNYSGIGFMIGVDSTRNVSGAQTGALDPANGMFWTWNTGYIMAKLEGSSPQSTGMGGSVMLHIGGFSGANNSIRVITPSFNGDQAQVSGTVTPEIHFRADAAEWFKTPGLLNLATTNMIMMPGANAKMIADNYADMISVEHIHN